MAVYIMLLRRFNPDCRAVVDTRMYTPTHAVYLVPGIKLDFFCTSLWLLHCATPDFAYWSVGMGFGLWLLRVTSTCLPVLVAQKMWSHGWRKREFVCKLGTTLENLFLPKICQTHDRSLPVPVHDPSDKFKGGVGEGEGLTLTSVTTRLNNQAAIKAIKIMALQSAQVRGYYDASQPFCTQSCLYASLPPCLSGSTCLFDG